MYFVADPKPPDESTTNCRRCRPDDPADEKGTWRDLLQLYNQAGSNPYSLLSAAELYRPTACPDVYSRLVKAFGFQHVYILSAGWGLIRSDFLTPDYNITFAREAKKKKPEAFRDAKSIEAKSSEAWHDFNHLLDAGTSVDEPVHFLGGSSYLPLFYSLTTEIAATKVIHHKGKVPKRSGFKYQEHAVKDRYWYYPVATDFIRATG